MKPDCVEAHNNLGTALMELGRFSEAEAAFERAIVIDPECAEAHHNRSLVLLLTARFEEGWDEYEWRWRNGGFSTPLRPFSQAWWDGSLEGVTKLLVWAEQGIGDEVQFSGLIRQVLSRGIHVIVECDRRLVTLLQRSFPSIIVVERPKPPVPYTRRSNHYTSDPDGLRPASAGTVAGFHVLSESLYGPRRKATGPIPKRIQKR